jgi:benzoate membrane transport protein
MGSVPTCVTGPSNALLQASGEARTRYVGGMIFGLLAIAFSLCAPFMTALGEVLPVSYIQMLGGLAMWGVLQKTFISAFRTKFTLGALAAFVVSVSGIEIWQVGAAFWGLLFGFALSLLLEREDFRTLNS